ncbi:MAG: hypothetical protein ACJ71E_09795 [Nitrososphaeraceae archaeon]|jgi:hypothetical protein
MLMTKNQHMKHFKSQKGGKTAAQQADEFVCQPSVRGISVSIYEYGLLLLYEEMTDKGRDIRKE